MCNSFQIISLRTLNRKFLFENILQGGAVGSSLGSYPSADGRKFE
jgi:hypothetical protein